MGRISCAVVVTILCFCWRIARGSTYAPSCSSLPRYLCMRFVENWLAPYAGLGSAHEVGFVSTNASQPMAISQTRQTLGKKMELRVVALVALAVVAAAAAAGVAVKEVSYVGGDHCCKFCSEGSKACGDGCISDDLTCHQGPGCACNGEGSGKRGGAVKIRAGKGAPSTREAGLEKARKVKMRKQEGKEEGASQGVKARERERRGGRGREVDDVVLVPSPSSHNGVCWSSAIGCARLMISFLCVLFIF